MNFNEDAFTKELAELLNKHKVTIHSTQYGLCIATNIDKQKVYILKPSTTAEMLYHRLFIISPFED